MNVPGSRWQSNISMDNSKTVDDVLQNLIMRGEREREMSHAMYIVIYLIYSYTIYDYDDYDDEDDDDDDDDHHHYYYYDEDDDDDDYYYYDDDDDENDIYPSVSRVLKKGRLMTPIFESPSFGAWRIHHGYPPSFCSIFKMGYTRTHVNFYSID